MFIVQIITLTTMRSLLIYTYIYIYIYMYIYIYIYIFMSHASVQDIPLDPEHTAEAASLLLRVVRSLPGRLPLRSMLEPLTQVLLLSGCSHTGRATG